MTEHPASCLRRHSGRGQPLVRLVCFSWCGAGASVYRRLAAQLADHIELLAVQLPGREDVYRRSRLHRMNDVIDYVLPDVLRAFDRPLYLFGHSMGAFVAHELALAMRERSGREPDGLMVSGSPSPVRQRPATLPWHLADDETLIAHLRGLGGTPEALFSESDMMNMLLPLLRADYEVLDTYEPRVQAPLSCPLSACAGHQDAETRGHDLSAWRPCTTGAFESHWFVGGHFYLDAEAGVLAQRLQEWIAATGFARGMTPAACEVNRRTLA